MPSAALVTHQNTATRPVPLLDLPPGTVAVLRHVADHHSRAVLHSLGLVEGGRLRLSRVGDPCVIQVRSTRIGLSKAVARFIHVVVADERGA